MQHPQTPLGLEALILIKSWSKTDRVSPKTGRKPGLKPYKIHLKRKITMGGPTTQRPYA